MFEFGKIHVKIKGLTPLLMNRLTPEDLASGGVKKKRYDPEVEARKSAYITTVDGKEQLYIPGRWLYSMIVSAAGAYKAQGRRASLSSLLAGTIRVDPEEILLGHCNYEIDERVVRIGDARVLAWRPKVKDWTAEFDIIYNKTHVTPSIAESLKGILEDAGIRLGIGDFRPQHKGPFGTFTVEEFKIVS